MHDSLYMASIYRLTGVNFLQSAKHLSEKIEVDDRGVPTKLTSLPFYFLVSHATELLLKSALLKRGFSEQELRKFDYRHNLDKLLTVLMAKGVTVTPETTSLVVSFLSSTKLTHFGILRSLTMGNRPTCLRRDYFLKCLRNFCCSRASQLRGSDD